ncbi:hypothetical protein HF324_17290 [Chitinophaga oryzae]|uniref:Uncharacterized protein n=1 Tax=Chitinophaga oryzae TaxID=2725414 RepID=A0AAE6ZHY1_9BACT|nr:hypothetical protein [Chitinophaga oryzae]QJB33043.1 hypothetical protein HF329_17660 [Chitinophaga oryzae]QJB39517.1 hypothetical protein HF324_17290 [Chitinophaga oryzae]
MKKQLLALAGMALLFVSCSKKDGPSPPPQPEASPFAGLLKGMYNVSDTSRYEYNDDKTVSKVRNSWKDGADAGGSIVTMKYANGKISEMWESTYDKTGVFGPNRLITAFTYADKNILKIWMWENANNELTDSIRYNAGGKMEKIFRIARINALPVIINTDSLVWTGNNITKLIRESTSAYGGEGFTDMFVHDDKRNVYLDVQPAMLDGSYATEPFNANNIVKVTRTKGNKSITNNIQYKYNDKNKVIERISAYNFDEGPGIETTVFEYYQ